MTIALQTETLEVPARYCGRSRPTGKISERRRLGDFGVWRLGPNIRKPPSNGFDPSSFCICMTMFVFPKVKRRPFAWVEESRGLRQHKLLNLVKDHLLSHPSLFTRQFQHNNMKQSQSTPPESHFTHQTRQQTISKIPSVPCCFGFSHTFQILPNLNGLLLCFVHGSYDGAWFHVQKTNIRLKHSYMSFTNQYTPYPTHQTSLHIGRHSTICQPIFKARHNCIEVGHHRRDDDAQEPKKPLEPNRHTERNQQDRDQQKSLQRAPNWKT